MKSLLLAKSAAELLVSVGAGAVVGNAIRASAPANGPVLSKLLIGIGGFAISNFVGDLVANYTATNIEKGIEQIQQVKTAVAEATTDTDTPEK